MDLNKYEVILLDENGFTQPQTDEFKREIKTLQAEHKRLLYEKGILVHMIEDGNIMRDSLKAENDRLRKVEEKARAVIVARKTMKHIERSSSFFELIAALNELQDALKGGS